MATGINFYAHTNDRGRENWQLLRDHLLNTANLAFEFGKSAGVSEMAYTAGILHDLGKFSQEFQNRLNGSPQKVDHSSAGAKELLDRYRGEIKFPLAMLLAYCIIGHHAGLPDYGSSFDLPGEGTLNSRLNTPVCDYSAYIGDLRVNEFPLPERLNLKPIPKHLGFSLAFLTRMVFSALVDADYQETETFLRGKAVRGEHELIETLCLRYNAYLSRFSNPQREIDRVRTEILCACIEKSELDQGFYSLTVPTGGGKTLASMAFALNHAKKHNLERIVYVIPFTTIIEQNAEVFRHIIGKENILEHHSNFDWENLARQEPAESDNKTNNAYSKLKLATENWDIPIVVTTNVQFFESLFANRSSQTRKLHNLARSVIIFDEAQMLPKEFLLPSMYAIRELVVNYAVSAVFCTATQPELHKFLPDGKLPIELAPDPQKLFDFFKRVDVEMLGKVKDADLIDRLKGHKQVLCIVNTRRHAKGLFVGIQDGDSFHLSTLMCPSHRKTILEEIKKRMKDGLPCRVISTSVLEAGVDLDFPVGYRALAGLDSINQAAGRINREMRRDLGVLYVFEADTDLIKKVPKFVAQNIEVVRSILRNYKEKPISIEAIRSYFELLYNLRDWQDFDFKRIVNYFEQSQPYKFDFATAAQEFRLIDEKTVTVIVPYDAEARTLIEELKTTSYPMPVLRKLQSYTVNIYEEEFDILRQQGAILLVSDKFAILKDLEHYNAQTGVDVPTRGNADALFY